MVKLRPAAIAAGLALSCALAAQPSAQAATASNLTTIDMGYNDSFWNYDFASTAGGNTNVDWAMSLLFYSNANIDKVKGLLNSYGGFYNTNGTQKYARISDGAGGLWDDDGGVKTGVCSGSHTRLYADPPPGDDRMNNPTFGYYIIASTHEDNYECPGGPTPTFGNSEAVENDIIADFRFNGHDARDDRYGWANYEPTRCDGNHCWSNNGLASTVIIR